MSILTTTRMTRQDPHSPDLLSRYPLYAALWCLDYELDWCRERQREIKQVMGMMRREGEDTTGMWLGLSDTFREEDLVERMREEGRGRLKGMGWRGRVGEWGRAWLWVTVVGCQVDYEDVPMGLRRRVIAGLLGMGMGLGLWVLGLMWWLDSVLY